MTICLCKLIVGMSESSGIPSAPIWEPRLRYLMYPGIIIGFREMLGFVSAFIVTFSSVWHSRLRTTQYPRGLVGVGSRGEREGEERPGGGRAGEWPSKLLQTGFNHSIPPGGFSFCRNDNVELTQNTHYWESAGPCTLGCQVNCFNRLLPCQVFSICYLCIIRIQSTNIFCLFRPERQYNTCSN